jgi:replicative DNA helicase
MSDSYLQLPPFDENVEQVVLGSIFLEPNLMNEIENTVKPQTFHIELHQDIYKAMLYLHYQNDVVNYNKVMDRMKYSYKKNKVNKQVDVDYIFSISDSVPSVANFEHYSNDLIDLAHKRDLWMVSKWVIDNDIKGVSSANLVKMLSTAMENVSVTSNVDLVSTKSYTSEWLEDFKKPISHDKLSFGFKLLDDFIMLEKTNLGIIGARPGVGKSAYALNLAKNFCLQSKNVLFITLEMSAKEVMNRLVANISGVDHDSIQRKLPLTESQEKSIEEAANKVNQFNLTLYDKGSLTADHLYNLAKKLHKQGKLDILIIDYLQLMDGGKRSNGSDVQDISYITRKLKQLAQEIYIPIIALSQLSRAGAQASGKFREPQLSDLRSSGSIEQDANFVLMLHDTDEEQKYQDHKFLKLYIRKNRSGGTGVINLQYYGDNVHFEERVYNTDTNQWEKVEQKIWKDEVIQDDELSDLPF